MASTTFQDQVTTIVSSWLQDVNTMSYLAAAKVTAGGTSDALTASYIPAIPVAWLSVGGILPVLLVTAAAANATTTPTFTPNPGVVAPVVITKLNGQALLAGDIAGAGHDLQLQWNPVALTWSLLNPQGLTSTALTPALASASPVIGSSRNLRIYQSAAGTSLTMTADELTIQTSLGGLSTKLYNLNQSIVSAASGIGGMDTGIAPVSTFVYIYEMEGPGEPNGLMGTISCTGNIYTGGHLPAGYAGGALVSVWAVNASSQFTIGLQRDRVITFPNISVLNTSTSQASYTSLSIASAVPVNATSVFTTSNISTSTTSAAITFELASDASGTGLQESHGNVPLANAQIFASFNPVLLATSQTVYYIATTSAGTPAYALTVSGYTI